MRTPYADTSLYPIPEGADEEALVMLSDILPTGFECGVLKWQDSDPQEHRSYRRCRANRARRTLTRPILYAG